MSRLFFLLILFITFTACAKSNYIHPLSDQNQVINGFYNHVLNDSLQFYHRTFGDIHFEKNKKELRRLAKKNHLTNLLLYGKSEMQPFYEYFILLNPKEYNAPTNFIILKDSIVYNQRLQLLAKDTEVKKATTDFDYMASETIIGKKYRSHFISIFEILQNNRNHNAYLKAYKELESYPTNTASDKQIQNQLTTTYLSFMGKSDRLTAQLDQLYRFQNNLEDQLKTPSILEQKLLNTILSDIVEKTKEATFVLFNENHSASEQRTLIRLLLPYYKNAGFRNLALEALNAAHMDDINAGISPDLQSGFYTRENEFFQLIKEAQHLGFNIIGYDSEAQDREIGQAENLMHHTIKKDASAKTIVLAGGGHIIKTASNSKKMMAYYLKEMSQDSVISISQNRLYRYKKVAKPLLFIPNQALNEPQSGIDYHIVNNLDSRPIDTNFEYDHKENSLKQLLLFENDRFEGIHPTAYSGEIADYSQLLEPNQKYSFQLKNKAYRLIILDENGEKKQDRLISPN